MSKKGQNDVKNGMPDILTSKLCRKSQSATFLDVKTVDEMMMEWPVVCLLSK